METEVSRETLHGSRYGPVLTPRDRISHLLFPRENLVLNPFVLRTSNTSLNLSPSLRIFSLSYPSLYHEFS